MNSTLKNKHYSAHRWPWTMPASLPMEWLVLVILLLLLLILGLAAAAAFKYWHLTTCTTTSRATATSRTSSEKIIVTMGSRSSVSDVSARNRYSVSDVSARNVCDILHVKDLAPLDNDVSRSSLPNGNFPSTGLVDYARSWSPSFVASSSSSASHLPNLSLDQLDHQPRLAESVDGNDPFPTAAGNTNNDYGHASIICGRSSSPSCKSQLELSCFSDLGLVSIGDSSSRGDYIASSDCDHAHALDHVYVAIPAIDVFGAAVDTAVDAEACMIDLNLEAVDACTMTVPQTLSHICCPPNMLHPSLPAQARLVWKRMADNVQSDASIPIPSQQKKKSLESISLDDF